MKIPYKTINYHQKTRQLLEKANEIITGYPQGTKFTVRQLYYQFVARNLIPNCTNSYGLISRLLDNGRMTGDIDWDVIVDRTTEYEEQWHSTDIGNFLENVRHHYRLDKRDTQDIYLEVWFEKAALTGIIGDVCTSLDVGYMCCGGQSSRTILYNGACRFRYEAERGKKCVLLYLGDFDPCGIEMDYKTLPEAFDDFHISIEIERIAITKYQIKAFNIPPNPVKEKARVAPKYIRKYGEYSWELDAIPPNELIAILQDEIKFYTNIKKWKQIARDETKDNKVLGHIIDNWETI